jgi:hypothetical protein
MRLHYSVKISLETKVPVIRKWHPRRATHRLLKVTSICTTSRRAVDQVGGVAWISDTTLKGADVALNGGRGSECTDSDSEGHEGGRELHDDEEKDGYYWFGTWFRRGDLSLRVGHC